MDDKALIDYYKSSNVLNLNGYKIPYVELWYGGKEGISEENLSGIMMDENFEVDNRIVERIDELKEHMDLSKIEDNPLASLTPTE